MSETLYKCSYCKMQHYSQDMVWLNGKPYNRCLSCNRAMVKAWKKKNPAKVVRITVRYGQRYKWKRRATDAVKAAIKKGTITRPKYCSVCGGRTSSIHAHHDDYLAVLEVVFLCPKCHSEKHSTRKTDKHEHPH